MVYALLTHDRHADNAGEPGHCALCGRPDARCLCRACREAWTVDGVLAPQVAAMQRDAKRATDQARSTKVILVPLGEDW